MKLKCKRIFFEQTKKIGISLMSRDVKEQKQLSLTVGKEYEVQVCSRINKDNVGSVLNTNYFLDTQFFLVVFSDKGMWEYITVEDILVSDELKSKDEINQLLLSVFDNP